MPLLTGTQSDQGRFVMPDFDDALYAALQTQGYRNEDLYNDASFSFRTGPFRIAGPAHHGATNLATAPQGLAQAKLQFALPSEGIDAPSSVKITKLHSLIRRAN